MIKLTDDFPDPFAHWARGNDKVLAQVKNPLVPNSGTAFLSSPVVSTMVAWILGAMVGLQKSPAREIVFFQVRA